MQDPAKRLQEIRAKRGFKSARAAAQHFGWHEATYTSHENGTRKLTRVFRLYAKAFRVDEAWLRGLTDDPDTGVRGVPVTGEAALGVWRDAAVEPPIREPARIVDVPAAVGDQPEFRFAIHVVDDSINKVVPNGWYAICAPLADRLYQSHEFVDDDVLYIERNRRGLKETSLRRVSVRNGDKLRLSTWSTEAKLAHDVIYPASGPGEKIRLIGRLVGRYADYKPDLSRA
jgi:hypothetical protein